MENAASQAMARKRRPVRCRDCGYVTTPVSGFCPNCLERLPIGRRIGVVPIVAILGLVALGAAVVAASSTAAASPTPGPVGGQSTPRASGNLPSTATVDEVH